MIGPNWRRAHLVTRIELRRTLRSLLDSARGILVLAGVGLFVPAYSLGIGAIAFFGGGALTELPTADVRTAVVAVLLGLLTLVTFVEVQRSAKQIGEPDGLDGLLTTLPYTDVLAGVVGAELARALAVLGAPVLALAVGLSAGTGFVLVGPVVLVTTLLVVTLGLLLGYAGGLTVKLVAARSAFVARHRASIGSAASLLLTVGWLAVWSAQSGQLAILRALTDSPLLWLADVVLVAVPGTTADPLAVVVGGVALVGSLPVTAVGCRWLAERVWYVDPVQPDHEFDPDERTLSDRLLAGRVPSATRVVAQKSWLRARRAPFTVQFAVVPVFLLLVSQGQFLLRGRGAPTTLPLTVGVATAAAFGAAFTLNPLGGEEGVLPLTLTTAVSGRAFVAGLVLAGVLPGLVVAPLVVVGLGAAVETPSLPLLAALATALVATVAAPAIAAGCGVVFPKFEPSSVHGRDVTVPSSFAFGGYFLVFGAVVAPASAAVLLSIGLPFPVPVETPALLAGGLAATAVLGGLATVAGFLYAANRVATYRLP
ncbi:hypothetical protein [Haloarcula pellucida]|uniref:ABC-2 type transport system permease protein n=1 Tax=Haloarcula pellucida TaxID=1427151 RepID=A0A830GNU1_9EURY|nr:hypothetical protein [Halomicroarcula pellucida]MBX0350188.1 hypothetical protein [Halomicroarcula pellucida]GGO00807.1 hypothetical protein GCM10009030_33870 [Halomicroarcula pellucida]